jgi:hypothetical protein
LGKFYQNLLATGMEPAMARLTLARKIAAIALTIWKKINLEGLGEKDLELIQNRYAALAEKARAKTGISPTPGELEQN